MNYFGRNHNCACQPIPRSLTSAIICAKSED
jgi:hypothetical protein